MQSVRQEEDGDVAGAEKSLRQANMVSRYYTPRWSFAAFYYRQGNKTEFIHWARSAHYLSAMANRSPYSKWRRD